jgi:opacity protein-like surface antigen
VGFAGAAGPLAAQEDFRFGSMEITLSAGYSVSHTTVGDVDTVNGFHLIPHFGVFVTDEHGPGWVKGNLEVLAEPTLIYFDSDQDSATLVGLSALGRWVFNAGGRVKPFVEAGVGILGGDTNFRQTDCDVNFILQGGVGALVFLSPRTALTAGYRFHHVSNADTCDKNLGINSSLFILGASYFFP